MAYREVLIGGREEHMLRPPMGDRAHPCWTITLAESWDGYLFCDWALTSLNPAKVIATGTFRQLYPTWQSIVLMVLGKDARSIQQWEQ